MRSTQNPAIHLLDQSVTLSMLRDGFTRREHALSLLRQSLPDLLRLPARSSQKEIFAILQKHNQGSPIVSNPSTIELDQMRFCFAPDGSLERIEHTDDYGPQATDTPTHRPAIP